MTSTTFLNTPRAYSSDPPTVRRFSPLKHRIALSRPLVSAACLFASFLLLLAIAGYAHRHWKDARPRHANIAFFIQIMPSTMGHLPRLFRRIYHPDNVYAIHFDKSVPDADATRVLNTLYRLKPRARSNTFVIPTEVIVYNGVSMVLNIIGAMSFLLHDVAPSWDFFIHLSGTDYPLVKPQVPRKLLSEALPYAPVFMALARREKWETVYNLRSATMYFDPSLSHSRSPGDLIETAVENPVSLNLSITPVHAEVWAVFSRRFCEYVVNSPASRLTLLTFANMRGSDEFFFGTLAYNNAEFNRSLVPHAFRKVIWREEGKHAGQHPYPLDSRNQDGTWKYAEMLRESPQWFARKFEAANSELMDIVDKNAADAARDAKLTAAFRQVMVELVKRYDGGGGQGDSGVGAGREKAALRNESIAGGLESVRDQS